MVTFITDERTGLEYELCGDYYIIAGEDEPEREPIGIWGQRHLNYIQKHCKPFYYKMLGEHTLYDYLCQINQDVEDMYIVFFRQLMKYCLRHIHITKLCTTGEIFAQDITVFFRE